MSKFGRKAADWSGEYLDRAFGLGVSEYIFYLMLQANRRREAALGETFEGIGLTISKFRALAVVSRLKTCAMNELSNLSSVDRTTLTRTIDQLVSDGLVERFPAPTDRRLILLRLSEQGRAVMDRAREINKTYNQKILSGVSEEQQIAGLRMLQQIIDNMIPDDEIAHGVLTFRHTSSRTPET